MMENNNVWSRTSGNEFNLVSRNQFMMVMGAIVLLGFLMTAAAAWVTTGWLEVATELTAE